MVTRTRLKPELTATVGRWEYIWCHCLVKIGGGGGSFTHECDGCGNANLRFIQTLESPDNRQQIWVAEQMPQRRKA